MELKMAFQKFGTPMEQEETFELKKEDLDLLSLKNPKNLEEEKEK
jgi:hypothetical protein